MGRNNSIITDIMTGQLKSTVTCLECGYISITFDPYNTIQAPIPQTMSVDVMYVPYNIATKNEDDEMVPTRMPYLDDVVISDKSTAGELKQKYAKRLGKKLEDLFVITKGNDEIVDHLEDNYKLADVDTQKLYTKVYDVPPPQDVPNPVEPIIKDGKAKLSNDELVEFVFYV